MITVVLKGHKQINKQTTWGKLIKIIKLLSNILLHHFLLHKTLQQIYNVGEKINEVIHKAEKQDFSSNRIQECFN